MKKYISVKFPKYNRKSSIPFISGDTFRNYCHHIFDETNTFLNPKKVKQNEFIFIKTDFISIFFKNIHPKINNSYNLITHNSDLSVSNNDILLKDNKIKLWFAQNLNVEAKQDVLPLPIGLENLRFNRFGKINNFQIENKKDLNKIILSSFETSTNFLERKELKNIAKELRIVQEFKTKNNKVYANELSKFFYNLCPSGNGLDSHRVWESLCLNVIPIMIKNTFSQNLNNIGIPILLLNNWEDLYSLKADYLIYNYEETVSKNNLQSFSTFNYWKTYIESNLNQFKDNL